VNEKNLFFSVCALSEFPLKCAFSSPFAFLKVYLALKRILTEISDLAAENL